MRDHAPATLPNFLNFVRLIDLQHRLLHDTIRDELTRLGIRDLNSVQAMMLLHWPDRPISAFELRKSRLFLGSNPTYSLKDMKLNGYLVSGGENPDRRLKLMKMTAKGIAAKAVMQQLLEGQLEKISNAGLLDYPTLPAVNDQSERMVRHWQDNIRHLY